VTGSKVDGVLLGFFYLVVDGWIRSYLEDTGRDEDVKMMTITVHSFYEEPHGIAHCCK
jgi:hypothetical protein